MFEKDCLVIIITMCERQRCATADVKTVGSCEQQWLHLTLRQHYNKQGTTYVSSNSFLETRAVSSLFGFEDLQQTVSVPKKKKKKKKSLISTISKLEFQLKERSQKAQQEQLLLHLFAVILPRPNGCTLGCVSVAVMQPDSHDPTSDRSVAEGLGSSVHIQKAPTQQNDKWF